MKSKYKARGLIIKDGKILLIFRNKYSRIYFSLPGGGEEVYDESVEATVVREVLEESSIVVKVVKHLHSYTNDAGEIQYLYLCEYISGTPELGDNVELAKMQANQDNFYMPMWVSIEDVANIPVRPRGFCEFVRGYVKGLELQTA